MSLPKKKTQKTKREKCTLKWCITQPHLFKKIFQYQMANFSNAKTAISFAPT